VVFRGRRRAGGDGAPRRGIQPAEKKMPAQPRLNTPSGAEGAVRRGVHRRRRGGGAVREGVVREQCLPQVVPGDRRGDGVKRRGSYRQAAARTRRRRTHRVTRPGGHRGCPAGPRGGGQVVDQPGAVRDLVVRGVQRDLPVLRPNPRADQASATNPRRQVRASASTEALLPPNPCATKHRPAPGWRLGRYSRSRHSVMVAGWPGPPGTPSWNSSVRTGAGPVRNTPVSAPSPASASTARTTRPATNPAAGDPEPGRHAGHLSKVDELPARWPGPAGFLANSQEKRSRTIRTVRSAPRAGPEGRLEEGTDQRAPFREAVRLAEPLRVRLPRCPTRSAARTSTATRCRARHPGVAEPVGGGGQWQGLPVGGGEVILTAGLNGELGDLQNHAPIMPSGSDPCRFGTSGCVPSPKGYPAWRSRAHRPD